MFTSTGPLKKLRLITLILALALSIVSCGLGLNALIKSNNDKSRVKKLAPAPAVVYIDTSDIFGAGVAATTASLLIALLVFFWIVAMYMPSKWCKTPLRLQSFTLFFGCAFLFASMLPYMVFFVNREASVKAFVGTIQLPDSTVKSVEDSLGVTRVYKKIHYLKPFAVVSWFALVFTLIAAAVLFIAGRASTKETHVPPAGSSSPETTEKDDKP